MSHPFFIVDVFAEQKYAGNQLAVICNAADLSTEQMQAIAVEMNYSETSFILHNHETDGGWDVRIFTPAAEVPFAGHPTLGTAHVIASQLLRREVPGLTLKLKVGKIPVQFSGAGEKQLIWMQQIQPWFGATFSPREVAEVLSIEEADIDTRYPIIEASTGLPFIICPLKSLDAVKRSRTNHDRHLALLANHEVKDFMVFCPETNNPENTLNARVFVDFLGIPEDPATGSANGCLAAYLLKYQYLSKSYIDIRVEQGFEMNRPSILYLKASVTDSTYDIRVGGKVILTARGELV